MLASTVPNGIDTETIKEQLGQCLANLQHVKAALDNQARLGRQNLQNEIHRVNADILFNTSHILYEQLVASGRPGLIRYAQQLKARCEKLINGNLSSAFNHLEAEHKNIERLLYCAAVMDTNGEENNSNQEIFTTCASLLNENEEGDHEQASSTFTLANSTYLDLIFDIEHQRLAVLLEPFLKAISKDDTNGILRHGFIFRNYISTLLDEHNIYFNNSADLDESIAAYFAKYLATQSYRRKRSLYLKANSHAMVNVFRATTLLTGKIAMGATNQFTLDGARIYAQQISDANSLIHGFLEKARDEILNTEAVNQLLSCRQGRKIRQVEMAAEEAQLGDATLERTERALNRHFAQQNQLTHEKLFGHKVLSNLFQFQRICQEQFIDRVSYAAIIKRHHELNVAVENLLKELHELQLANDNEERCNEVTTSLRKHLKEHLNINTQLREAIIILTGIGAQHPKHNDNDQRVPADIHAKLIEIRNSIVHYDKSAEIALGLITPKAPDDIVSLPKEITSLVLQKVESTLAHSNNLTRVTNWDYPEYTKDIAIHTPKSFYEFLSQFMQQTTKTITKNELVANDQTILFKHFLALADGSQFKDADGNSQHPFESLLDYVNSRLFDTAQTNMNVVNELYLNQTEEEFQQLQTIASHFKTFLNQHFTASTADNASQTQARNRRVAHFLHEQKIEANKPEWKERGRAIGGLFHFRPSGIREMRKTLETLPDYFDKDTEGSVTSTQNSLVEISLDEDLPYSLPSEEKLTRKALQNHGRSASRTKSVATATTASSSASSLELFKRSVRPSQETSSSMETCHSLFEDLTEKFYDIKAKAYQGKFGQRGTTTQLYYNKWCPEAEAIISHQATRTHSSAHNVVMA